MPRVAGIDAGTLSLDACGLDHGRVFLDASWPTAELLRDPTPLLEALLGGGTLDLVVGPSGYGLPLRPARDASDEELRLAFLAPPGEPGGIGGLRALTRGLQAAGVPLVFTPGVLHLETVPRHRKLNRIDLGTADKVCTAALGIVDQGRRRGRAAEDASFVILELGGAFTGGLAVERGQIVDGMGGSSGPIGWRAAGALDGEVAFLAGEVTKAIIFDGGVDRIVREEPGLRAVAVEAYIEGAARAARQLLGAAANADEILLSGRHAADSEVRGRLAAALEDVAEVRLLEGFSATAKQGAQGAAIMADGLAGGRYGALVDRLGIREAKGTVLDHLFVISLAAARRRLGFDRV